VQLHLHSLNTPSSESTGTDNAALPSGAYFFDRPVLRGVGLNSHGCHVIINDGRKSKEYKG
jgi:hypothetical protein